MNKFDIPTHLGASCNLTKQKLIDWHSCLKSTNGLMGVWETSSPRKRGIVTLSFFSLKNYNAWMIVGRWCYITILSI